MEPPKDPLVSVIIPTFNHAHFLGRALQSVVAQTYPHWEALVIDNHSQDNTVEVVNSFCDPRIRLLKIHNQGVIGASRNLGILDAKGDWVAFLDSDDCWYPHKLSIIMVALQNDDTCDVVSNDEFEVDLKTGAKRILRYGPAQSDFYKKLLVEGNRLSPSATVIRHAFLVAHGLGFGESPEHITVEDYDLWLNLARTGAKFKFIHEVLGEYSIHDTNNSGRHLRHRMNSRNLLRDHVYRVQIFEPDRDKLWRQIRVRLAVQEAKEHIAQERYVIAVRILINALLKSPVVGVKYVSSWIRRRIR